MSERFPGGFITKTPIVPTTSSASGVWTLDQAMGYIKSGTWPTPPDYWAVLISNFTPFGYSIRIDSSQNIYVASQVTTGGVGSIAYLKLTKAGSVANQNDYSYGNTHNGGDIALDSSGNVVLLSTAGSGNYPPCYPLMLDSSFNVLKGYGISASGNNSCNGTYLACDSSGNTYIAGSTYSGSSGLTRGAFFKVSSGGALSFSVAYSTAYGAYAGCATVDSSGGPYIGGGIQNASFNTEFQMSKWTTAGAITWTKTLAYSYVCCCVTIDYSYCLGINVSPNGNVIGVGNFRFGSYQAVIVAYNSSGTLQWQRRITNSGSSFSGVATDSSNNIYAVGTGDGSGVLIVKYNSSGTIQWQRSITGGSLAGAYGITIDSTDNCMLIYAQNPTNMIFRLPTDGSHTGSFTISGTTYTYAASSFTGASGILNGSSNNPSATSFSAASIGTSTPTKNTNSASTTTKASV